MRERLNDDQTVHRNRDGEVTMLVQIRVPIPLVKRLDEYRATILMHPSRQQTIRWIIQQHLNEVTNDER